MAKDNDIIMKQLLDSLVEYESINDYSHYKYSDISEPDNTKHET